MKSLTLGLYALVINFASAYTGDMTYFTPGHPSNTDNSFQALLIIHQVWAPAATPTLTPMPS